MQAKRAVWIPPANAGMSAPRLRRLQDVAAPVVAQVLNSRDMQPEQVRGYLGPGRG